MYTPSLLSQNMGSECKNHTTPLTAETAKTEWIRIPNTLANFAWPKAVNPHQLQCSQASHDWLTSFGMLSPRAAAIAWNGNNGYLASLSYAQLPRHGCQIGCDLMNTFLLLDGTTDCCASAEEGQIFVDCFMDALCKPETPRPKGEWKGASVAQSFMQRMLSFGTSDSCVRRFVDKMQQFCDGVVEQAGDRSRGHIRDVETYFQLRRYTIGAYPCYTILQHEMELPDEIYEHEVLRRLEQLATDMIILDNDLLSYNVEQARGDEAHNLVTVLMNQFNFSLQESIDWVGKHYERLMDEFLKVYSMIPTVFQGDEDVQRYAWGVGNWVRGNWQWSWEGSRYFPNMDGLDSLVNKEGLVALLPEKKTV